MRKLSLILLAVCAVLMGGARHASAQYFNYTTDFETAAGGHVINAYSIDTNSWLGLNDIMLTGVNSQPGGATPFLYQFATNGTSSTGGTFNYAYRVAVTVVPANAAGTPLAGYSAVTEYVTGTITGTLTNTTNNLTNTYNNLVATQDGQAEVLYFTFSGAGVPTQTYQLNALANGFNNGGSPIPQGGRWGIGPCRLHAGARHPGSVLRNGRLRCADGPPSPAPQIGRQPLL